MTILSSDKKDFKTNAVARDREAPYVLIKGSNPEKNVIIANINIGEPKYIKQILKEEIDSNTIIVRDYNIPLT